MADTSEYVARLLAHTGDDDPIAIQSDTASLLSSLIDGVSEDKLRSRPAPETWSVAEVLAHLAEAEIAVSWRYRQMVEQDGCALSAYDQNLWARLGDYASRSPHDSLQQFRLLRSANLALLQKLSPEEQSHRGVHAERGAITLKELVRHVAGHDRNHLAQVRKALGK